MADTLLIANSAPGGENVGSILVREMLDVTGTADIAFLQLSSNAEGQPLSFDSQCRIASPHEHGHRIHPGWRGSFSTFVDRVFRYERQIAASAEQALEYVKTVRPERVWAILSSTASIDIVAKVEPHMEAELLLQIWDDPLHLVRQRRLDRITRQRTLKRFRSLLSRAARVAVIGESMAEEYSRWTPASCIILRHGVSDRVVPQTSPSSNDEFRIGFTGGVYAHSAWRALQQGLDQLKWRIDGRQVVLVVAGSKVEFRSNTSATCRYLGWRSTEEVSSLLGDCDLLYVPQPFDTIQEPLARLSFPTKLSAYVGVGRPVFVHTPHYGSLVNFCHDHDFGLLCTSLNPADVAATLSKLNCDSNLYARLAKSSARVSDNVLSRNRFVESVESFLTGRQPTISIGCAASDVSIYTLAPQA